MAHELMVPAGFKERIPRRYERMLSGEKSISSQNGMLDDARTNEEILKGMMDRPFKVLKNPTGAPEPQWYELVNWVHNHEDEARRYEHRETGELVRTIKYGRQESKLTVFSLATFRQSGNLMHKLTTSLSLPLSPSERAVLQAHVGPRSMQIHQPSFLGHGRTGVPRFAQGVGGADGDT